MRLLRLFVATLCLAALGLAALPAHAAGTGTLTFSPPTWRNRAADRLVDKLNLKDCRDDAIASFSVSIRNVAGTFEVWSGAGCDQATNRVASAVNKTCVRVSARNLVSNDQRVEVHFRDMVAAYGSDPTAGIEECDASQSPGLQTRSLYFIVFDANTNNSLITGVPAWKFNYDVTPPPPPTSVTAGSGDKTLVTTFSAPTGGETNLLHYHFYCSPVGSPPVRSISGTAGTAGTDTGGTAGTDTGGTAGTDTGGTAGTAGAVGGTAGTDAVTIAGAGAAADTGGTTGATGGTTGATGGTAGTAGTTTTEAAAGADSATLDPSCTSSSLIPGEYPPAGAMDCGVIGAQGAKGGETERVLDNDMQYAVAVATEDSVNNIGKLSGLACNTPKDITGFYEAYTEAGGQAGGGYCTFAPAHRDSVAFGLLLVAAACAFVRRRR